MQQTGTNSVENVPASCPSVVPRSVPMYGETPETAGLYLAVFHGRVDPSANMLGWGENGPLIGPLKHVHTVYAGTVHIEFENLEAARRYGLDDTGYMFEMHDDMLVFDGKYYGDWSVMHFKPPAVTQPPHGRPMTSELHSALSKVIDMSREHINDIESGLEEGIYEKTQNTDIDRKRSALNMVENFYHANISDNTANVVQNGEKTASYLNYYRCPNDGNEWQDVWSSTCNDKCPVCNSEIEPYHSDELPVS